MDSLKNKINTGVGLSPMFRYSRLCREMELRLRNNKDVKIIIVARDAETGSGKTTLAVLLSMYFDRNWDFNKLFLDVDDYLDYYVHHAKPRESMIIDDAEAGVDARRHMSKQNVYVSKYWSLLRVKNNISILTLPSRAQVDVRLRMLAHYLIIVRRRGEAAPYKCKVHDISGDVNLKRLRNYRFSHLIGGEKELIYFNKIDSNIFDHIDAKKYQFVKREIKKDFHS